MTVGSSALSTAARRSRAAASAARERERDPQQQARAGRAARRGGPRPSRRSSARATAAPAAAIAVEQVAGAAGQLGVEAARQPGGHPLRSARLEHGPRCTPPRSTNDRRAQRRRVEIVAPGSASAPARSCAPATSGVRRGRCRGRRGDRAGCTAVASRAERPGSADGASGFAAIRRTGAGTIARWCGAQEQRLGVAEQAPVAERKHQSSAMNAVAAVAAPCASAALVLPAPPAPAMHTPRPSQATAAACTIAAPRRTIATSSSASSGTSSSPVPFSVARRRPRRPAGRAPGARRRRRRSGRRPSSCERRAAARRVRSTLRSARSTALRSERERACPAAGARRARRRATRTPTRSWTSKRSQSGRIVPRAALPA